MFPVKKPAFFVLRVVVVYVVLLAAWPLVGSTYSTWFRMGGRALYGSFGSAGVVRFRPADTSVSGGIHENRLYLWHRDHPNAVFTMSNSTRYVGYLPTVLVIGLIAATPLALTRRLWAMAWGLILVHGFIALRLGIALLAAFSGDGPWCTLHPGPFWRPVLATTAEILSNSPPVTFIVPVFIWAVVSFRRSDVSRLLRAPSAHRGDAPAERSGVDRTRAADENGTTAGSVSSTGNGGIASAGTDSVSTAGTDGDRALRSDQPGVS